MSKSEKIDALLESAILIFAKDGFEGASLRDIAAHANTSLSTIHMYFDSKVELYLEAHRRVWMEFSEERNALLQEALKSDTPELGNFVRALALPIVRRSLSDNERDIAELLLVRSMVTEQEHFEADPSTGQVLMNWVDSFARFCPEMPRKDIVIAYSFILSIIWSSRSFDRRYDDLLCDNLDVDLDEFMQDIVSFGCAGVQAMIDRRKNTSG